MGHALRLRDQLSTAHLAVTFSEQFLVDVRGFHLFMAERRDKKQNQLQKAGRCVWQGSYRAKGKATLEPSSSCHHEGMKPMFYRCKCDTQTIPTTSPIPPIQTPQVNAPTAHVKCSFLALGSSWALLGTRACPLLCCSGSSGTQEARCAQATSVLWTPSATDAAQVLRHGCPAMTSICELLGNGCSSLPFLSRNIMHRTSCSRDHSRLKTCSYVIQHKRAYKDFYREGKQHHNLEQGGFKLEEDSSVFLNLDMEENCLDDLLGCAVLQQLFKYLCVPQNFLRGHLHL